MFFGRQLHMIVLQNLKHKTQTTAQIAFEGCRILMTRVTVPLKLHERCVLGQQTKIWFSGVSLQGEFSLSPYQDRPNKYQHLLSERNTSCGTFVSDVLPTETMMCVSSYGVCQICPSSSAPADSADCGRLRFGATQLMTQTQRAKPAGTSLSRRPKIMRFRQLPSLMSNGQDTWESAPSVT